MSKNLFRGLYNESDDDNDGFIEVKTKKNQPLLEN